MANEWPPRPDEKGPVAPPPPPEIGLRTMQSDIKSVQAGEVAPSSQPVTPPQFSDVMEKADSDSQMGGESVMAAPSSKKSAKTMMLVIGVMVIAGGLGVFGYYVIYPKISSVKPASESVSQQPQPSPVTRIPHASYFVKPTAGTDTASFSTLTDNAITGELLKQSVNSPGNDVAKEILLNDSNGSQIALSAFLSVLTGNKLDPSALNTLFDEDFTTYLYYDNNGVWPGYVVKLKEGISPEIAVAAIQALESADLSFFYLDPVGLTFQSFKSGSYKGSATRYAAGSQAGASFNYAAFGNYLLINTSFSGLKAGVALLGL